MLYCENENYKLYNDNMLNMLDFIPKNSVASIITDPPYEISFMGKGWDNTGVAYQVDTWKKCLEVLKPGGYLLVFGATRTFHRIACAIEDAGFEIRDTMMWLYGSGFPKSHDIGLQIDRKNGVESKIIGRIKGAGSTGNNQCGNQTFISKNQYEDGTHDLKIAQNKWNGWGTCLKPAYEPIIVARKPFNGSLVDNVLKNGVGAINIDECRVGNEIRTTPIDSKDIKKDDSIFSSMHKNIQRERIATNLGRFPANVITDGSDEVAMGMPESKSNGGNRTMNDFSKYKGSMMNTTNLKDKAGRKESSYIAPSDEGSAMRYFYTAKASKKDRDEGLDMFESDYYELKEDVDIETINIIKRLLDR